MRPQLSQDKIAEARVGLAPEAVAVAIIDRRPAVRRPYAATSRGAQG